MQIAVSQREKDEQTEHIISQLPVHPQDGGVEAAEQERRVGWIQKLTAEQIQQVDTLVLHRWQRQGALAPAWMCTILPADPPRAFWNAEYYPCMGELVERLQQEQDVPGVRPARERDAAETTSSPQEMAAGQAASGLRGETQPMLLQGCRPEGQAAHEVEPEAAGVVYGVDAIMAGTAYLEDSTEPEDEARVSWIGSLALLLEAEAGARVHYEGKLVCGDPTPRELPSKEASGSPRKRALENNENNKSNTVCDLVPVSYTHLTLPTKRIV